MSVQITSNHKYRQPLDWWNLTLEEQAEFDFLDTPERQAEADFIRYRGQVYYLNDFAAIDASMLAHCKEFEGWDGYYSDSYFSGIVIAYSPHDAFVGVKVGTYVS